ncbi:segregation/condensation protein A [Nannocystis sp. ILAH1]|uniref:segregation/condensation protein A n=1 Tax=Nannocystis sp. ILAH1 TaxID=2996789 RepID=UPI002270969E|nr:segregation/condensation protein A [Nannocystis sp. ILAH1]MCY0986032.1 segregation/condensation protein A [Nannocystis sp. ILAH1]
MEQGSTGLGEGGPRPRERKGAASPIYSVELEVFEGPLDLLLHLVRKHELDILDIPISFVAEKYLAYLDVMRQLDLEIAGDYLVMAATLAYLKSRELLPPEPRAREAGQSEEEEGEDPREALIRRLVEYERFKQAAAELDSLPVSGRDVFARGAELVMPPIDPGLAPVSLFNLAEAYYRVLTRAKVKSTHEVQIEAVTVAQRIKQLALILDEKPHFEFEELFLNRTWNSERELRAMLVVTLMSILEMVKLGVAGVQQPQDTTTIRIYRRASAQETQQALADYDEDASFGAPKPKDGEAERPAPSAPKRPTEAELDAVEEAALLAEALASVQEPEEPVVGYSDESEDVAANDPASEYDDEPRPAPRRSRSESRMARADVFEDRDEALDDGPDGRLVIVEGSSAEVPREPEGPRWGRRPGGTAEEESAASAADGAGRGEDVLEDMAELREDAADAGALDERSGAEDRLEGDRADAGDATPRPESVFEDRSEASDFADAADAGDEEPGAEGVLEGMSEAADASAGEEALDAEDVFEDRSEASSDVTSNSSERDGEALSVAVHEGRLDDAPGEEGVREGMSGAGIEVRSVGPDEGDGAGAALAGEDVLDVASTDSEFEAPDGVGPTAGGVLEGEPPERYEGVPDASESDGAAAGLEVDQGLASPESDGEPELSAPRREGAEGLGERVEAFLPAVGAPEATERQVDGDTSSEVDARSIEVDAAASADWPPGEDVLGDMSGADEDGEAIASSSTAAVEDAVEPSEVSAETAADVALLTEDVPEDISRADDAEEPAEASQDRETAHTVVDIAAELGEGASEVEEVLTSSDMASGARDAAEVLAATNPETFVTGGADAGSAPPPAMARDEAAEDVLTDSSAVGGADAEAPAATGDEVAEDVLEDRLHVESLEASEPASSAEERALEEGSTAIGGEAEPASSAEERGAGATDPTVAAGDETEDVFGASSEGGGVAATGSKVAAGEEDVLEASSMGGGFHAMESPAAAEDESAQEVLLRDSSTAEGIEATVPEEGGEDALGDSLATSTAADGDGAAEDVLKEELAAAEVESARLAEAVADAAAEAEDVPKDSLASGEGADEPAASDAEPSSSEDDASKPVRSDSDEDEAGGLFLNTGEGLGARELGDVDDDEDDAQ